MEYLKNVVRGIVGAICDTLDFLKCRYPQLDVTLCRTVRFITAQELEDRYPDMTDKQREDAITKEYGTVFLMGIGDKLESGKPHDSRAPDYDDWTLNGDLLLWNDVLGHALEISSMGIRVDAAALARQLEAANATDRMRFPYHQEIASGTLPLTVGGGIGQSRLCMLMLQKAHVGEVQVSVWSQEMIDACREHGIPLL